MKALCVFFFLLVSATCFAQRQNVYFLKNNGKYVDVRDSADYIRVVREPDSASTLYNVFEYYLNGNKKCIGKSTTIDPPRYEGQCLSFYANGKKQSLANYKKGTRAGDDFEFFPNGKPYIALTYPENDDTPDSKYRGNYLIKSCSDSLGNTLVTDGNGYYKGYDSKFIYIEEEGNIKNGRKDGQWKGEDRDMGLTFTESYNDGKLISGQSVSTKGETNAYSGSRSVYPQFKGGLESFGNYLSRNIHYPDEARSRNIQGRVILSFIVEKDGTLSGIKVNRSVAPLLDEEAVRVLNNSPKWIPGSRFGKTVRVTYSVPISFSLGN